MNTLQKNIFVIKSFFLSVIFKIINIFLYEYICFFLHILYNIYNIFIFLFINIFRDLEITAQF